MPGADPIPDLAPSIEIAGGGGDIAALARRFRAFDALHDGLEICIPMSGSDLDRVVELLHIQRCHTVLDVACGHGGMLKRLAARTSSLTGIDLSPWAVARSYRLLAPVDPRVSLIVGDAARLPTGRRWTHMTCLGASWIFHGFKGTIRSLNRRLRPAGMIAVGDLRRRPDSVTTPRGVLTAADQRHAIEALGGSIVDEVVADDQAWEHYSRAVVAAANSYRLRHPGDPSADHRDVAAQFVADAARDRVGLEFAVVVAVMPGAPVES